MILKKKKITGFLKETEIIDYYIILGKLIKAETMVSVIKTTAVACIYGKIDTESIALIGMASGIMALNAYLICDYEKKDKIEKDKKLIKKETNK